MTITIKIATDNAAFTDDKDAEVYRIMAEWLETVGKGRGFHDANLRDINGNTVGKVVVK